MRAASSPDTPPELPAFPRQSLWDPTRAPTGRGRHAVDRLPVGGEPARRAGDAPRARLATAPSRRLYAAPAGERGDRIGGQRMPMQALDAAMHQYAKQTTAPRCRRNVLALRPSRPGSLRRQPAWSRWEVGVPFYATAPGGAFRPAYVTPPLCAQGARKDRRLEAHRRRTSACTGNALMLQNNRRTPERPPDCGWRRKPLAFGAVLGVGFLNREFTAYGVAALLLIEAADVTGFRRRTLRDKLASLVSFAAVFQVVEVLKSIGSPFGPGTTIASRARSSGLEALVERSCWVWSDVPGWLVTMFATNLSTLFTGGSRRSWWILGGAAIVACARGRQPELLAAGSTRRTRPAIPCLPDPRRSSCRGRPRVTAVPLSPRELHRQLG